MQRRLAILALAFFIFCVQGYTQPQNAKQRTNGKQPSNAAIFVATQNANSPNLQPEYKDHVDADVRVVSSPAKDRYDRAAFWISVALAVVGIAGVFAAICTLLFIKAQVIEMRRQRIVMQRTLLSIKQQTGHAGDQTAILRDSVAAAQTSADAAKAQIEMMKDKERARIQVTPLDLEVIDPAEPNQIMLEFVNIGPTNAFDVRVEAGGKITVDGLKPEQGEYTDLAIPTLLRPDSPQSSWVVCDFPQRWQNQVVGDRVGITVELVGQIRYRDVFDITYIEDFAYRMNIYGIENMPRNFVRLKPIRKWHPFDLHPGDWEF